MKGFCVRTAVCRIVRVSGESRSSEYTKSGFRRWDGDGKEPFHGMKMYAKNQEVAACFPAAEKLKHFRLRDGRRGRTLDTPSEEPKLRQRRRRNCTWIYLFRPYAVFRSFFLPGNRGKIAPAANDEVECVKGKWKIHTHTIRIYILYIYIYKRVTVKLSVGTEMKNVSFQNVRIIFITFQLR